MLGHQNSNAAVADMAYGAENLHLQAVRNTDRRFIQQQQLGRAHERAADGDHLLLAAGQGADHLAAALLKNGEQLVNLVQISGDSGFVGTKVGAELQVFQHAEFRE